MSSWGVGREMDRSEGVLSLPLFPPAFPTEWCRTIATHSQARNPIKLGLHPHA